MRSMARLRTGTAVLHIQLFLRHRALCQQMLKVQARHPQFCQAIELFTPQVLAMSSTGHSNYRMASDQPGAVPLVASRHTFSTPNSMRKICMRPEFDPTLNGGLDKLHRYHREAATDALLRAGAGVQATSLSA